MTNFFLPLFLDTSGIGHRVNACQRIWTKDHYVKCNVNTVLPFTSSTDPLSLHQVPTVSEAGRVTQDNRKATDIQSRLHHISGGSGNGGHNCCRSLAWIWQHQNKAHGIKNVSKIADRVGTEWSPPDRHSSKFIRWEWKNITKDYKRYFMTCNVKRFKIFKKANTWNLRWLNCAIYVIVNTHSLKYKDHNK